MAKIGDSGNVVVAIQQAINDNAGACVLADDGVYGKYTANAVARFQLSHGISPADGVVDGVTAAALGVFLDHPVSKRPAGTDQSTNPSAPSDKAILSGAGGSSGGMIPDDPGTSSGGSGGGAVALIGLGVAAWLLGR